MFTLDIASAVTRILPAAGERVTFHPEDHLDELDRLQEARQDYWRRLGALPEPGPINLTVLANLRKSGYKQVLVEYDAFPGERIRAFILLPEVAVLPLPGIIAAHAHGGTFESGKERATGDDELWEPNRCGVELVLQGYAVICPDQLTFGERHDSRLPHKAHEEFEEFTRIAEGSSLAARNSFDISRAVDVLLAFPEVDRNRIGIIGHSGGGAQALAGCCYDPRIKVGVSSCGFADHYFRIVAGPVENVSWMVPGQLPAGDMASQMSLVAPRPFLMLNVDDDYLFPNEGVQSTYLGAKGVYERLGVGNRLQLHIEPGPHQFIPKMREIAYRFLDFWLKEHPVRTQEITYSNRRKATPLRDGKLTREELRVMLTARCISPVEPVGKLLESEAIDGVAREKVEIILEHDPVVEPFPWVRAYILKPLNTSGMLPVVFALHRAVNPYEIGKSEMAGVAGDESFVLGPALARAGFLVVCPDLPGCEDIQNPKIIDMFGGRGGYRQRIPAAAHIIAGDCLAARVCFNLNGIFAYLRERPDADVSRVSVAGVGLGSFYGALYAAVEPDVRSVCAIGGITTYSASKSALKLPAFGFSVPALAAKGDLGVVFGLLSPRPLMAVAFEEDPDWTFEGAEDVFSATKRAFSAADAAQNAILVAEKGFPAISEELRDRIISFLSLHGR